MITVYLAVHSVMIIIWSAVNSRQISHVIEKCSNFLATVKDWLRNILRILKSSRPTDINVWAHWSGFLSIDSSENTTHNHCLSRVHMLLKGEVSKKKLWTWSIWEHTWFNLHYHGVSPEVFHLFNFKQLIWISIVWWPVINKYTRSTASAVNNNPVTIMWICSMLVKICWGEAFSSTAIPAKVHHEKETSQ